MSIEDRPIRVIKASAGSGKTYQLSGRYIKLLLAGAEPDSVLATTFTRKAAGEIQDRILKRLGEGAVSESGARILSKQLTGDEGRISQEEFRHKTVEVVNSLNRLRICTLDAFFMQLASGYAFELGLPPSWTIVEEVDNDAILSDAIRRTFAQTNGKNAYEIAKLLFKGKTKKSIEKQVFDLTKKALEIYRNSDQSAWTTLKDDIESVDYDLVCSNLENAELPDHKGLKKGINSLLKALDQKNWVDIIKHGLVQNVAKGNFAYYKKPVEGNFKDAALGVKSLAASHTVEECLKELVSIWQVADSVVKFFDQEKAEEGAYRFEDLAVMLAKYLERVGKTNGERRPNSARATEYRLDVKTRALLLDEFQDASVTQWKIISPFAKLIVENLKSNLDATNATSSFFCVGDVKQAIYAWRGGVSEIFDEVEKTVRGAVGNSYQFVDSLNESRRSGPTIIDVVNKIFGDGKNNRKNLENNPVFASADADNPLDVECQARIAAQTAVREWSYGKIQNGTEEEGAVQGFMNHKSAENVENLDGFWALEAAPFCGKETSDDDFVANVQNPILDARSEEDKTKALRYITQDDFKRRFSSETLSVFEDDVATGEDDEDDEDASDGKSNGGAELKQRNMTLAYAARRIWELNSRYPKATIGVLMRSNDQLGEILRRLKKLGVPASDEGGAPILDVAAVGAILALLRLAARPGDSVDAFCLANLEPFADWLEIRRKDLLLCKLDPDDFKIETGRRVSAKLRNMIETKGVGKFVAEARDQLAPICDDPRSRERLDQLVDFAYAFQATSPNATLDAVVKAIESYKTQAPTSAKVRVMTIHGSKGLEFDIVVLPELDSNRSLADVSREQFVTGRQIIDGERSPLNPIEAVVVKANVAERQLLPERIQAYFNAASTQAVKEALCLLYVAITRPKRSLLAIVPPHKRPKTPKPPKLTFADILRCGLTDVEYDDENLERPRVLYYHQAKVRADDEDAQYADEWGADLQKDEEPERKASPQTVEKFRRPTFDPEGKARKRRLRKHKTPTGSPEEFLEDFATPDAQGFVAKPNRPRRAWIPPERFALGLCVHACFEKIEWLETPPVFPDVNKLLPLAEFNPEIAKSALRRFNDALKTKFVASLLSRRTYEKQDSLDDPLFRDVPCAVAGAAKLASPRLVVYCEKPYQYCDKNGTDWNGKFDRLVLLYDGARLVGADVVDFKSDERIVPQRLDEYCVQLKRYGEAVEKLYNLNADQISLRIAFVSLQTLVDARSGKTTVFDEASQE